MSAYSLREQLGVVARPDRTAMILHDQVAQLFTEAREDVYRYLLSLGLYPPQAQEATQEVFVRLYAALKKGEAIENNRAWIFRVAHNHGLKVRARESHTRPFEPDLEARIRSSDPDPEQGLLDKEKNLRFQGAIDRLSEQQRRCLFLRMEGLRYPEIGSALGISASAVGEFMRRAMKQLKKDRI